MEITKEGILNFEKIRRYLMSQVAVKTQELGMQMMSLKDELPFMDIWNKVQIYQGQQVAHYTVNLYILDLSLKKLP